MAGAGAMVTRSHPLARPSGGCTPAVRTAHTAPSAPPLPARLPASLGLGAHAVTAAPCWRCTLMITSSQSSPCLLPQAASAYRMRPLSQGYVHGACRCQQTPTQGGKGEWGREGGRERVPNNSEVVVLVISVRSHYSHSMHARTHACTQPDIVALLVHCTQRSS
jgi:hypothetical protein